MPKVRFTKENREIEVPEGANLRKEARQAGISVYAGIHKLANCRGLGMCGTCRVLIKKGRENASPMSWWERLRLKSPLIQMLYAGSEDQLRLSCQTQVLGDMDVETCPPPNLYGEKFWG